MKINLRVAINIGPKTPLKIEVWSMAVDKRTVTVDGNEISDVAMAKAVEDALRNDIIPAMFKRPLIMVNSWYDHYPIDEIELDEGWREDAEDERRENRA